MENKKRIFISILIFMIVLSIGVVSAQDADDAIASSNDDAALGDSEPVSGTVSGGVDVVAENPKTTSGEISYDIPNDAKTIKSANVYVNVYSGSAQNSYGANANVTIKTDNGDVNKNESLWISDGSTDGTVYTVNDHTTKCYSDYMIHYDITSLLTGLNGTNLKIKVDTYNMTGKSFDGRIKLIALVLAYDDGDDDTIHYWINSDQLWTKSNVDVTFNTDSLTNVYGASLTNIVLSSGDGTYRINNELLDDADIHSTGNGFYYQYNRWNNITSFIKENQNNVLNVAYAGTSAYGSIKNALSVLTVNNIVTTLELAPEYTTNIPSAYAGTNNNLTVKVNTNKVGTYLVKLLADGKVVDQTEIDLNTGLNTLYLNDPTIRDVDASTVSGADNKKVNYTVELLFANKTVNTESINIPVLYNGNLGKDLAYPAGGMESFLNIIVNGDIVVDAKDVSSKLGGSDMNRTDVWTINLGSTSSMVKSYIYVPYNWFNPTLGISEDLNMFNATFNGVKVTPIAIYRDQGNLGKYATYGYGVLVYDVTDLINASGVNSFKLTKLAETPSVYPSVLVYMYNTTGSNTIKEINIYNGADLLSATTANVAKRPVHADSVIDVYSKLTSDATLYVVASNAKAGSGDIVFNGETHSNVWTGSAGYATQVYTLDVTSKIKDSNSVSFVSTGSTILALQQIMVLTKDLNDVSISLAPEYTSNIPSAYAGTNNAITITIEALKTGKFTVKLLADGKVVNQTDIDLIRGTNKLMLIDPTIRDVNESTVFGAINDKVNYTVQLSSGGADIANGEINIPILYNGNLGKDLAYPAGGIESFLNITINGDIIIEAKDAASKLGSSDMKRTDVWTINLGSKSNIVKSYIYVPYNWFNPTLGISEDLNMFNATFNGVKVTPIAIYRDQGNLGKYAAYGYGVLVYDVTDLIDKSGVNSFNLTKLAKTPSVYPSVLVYMYNTTGSAVIKNVYISNGADLLAATTANGAGRQVHADSVIDITKVADTAKLYVVASNAMPGYGDIVFNGETHSDVWSGAGYATQVYTLDITNTIKNSNNISFVSTGGTILALQQIIVTTQKAPTKIAASAVTKVYNVNKNLVVTLKDSNGNVISNAKVTVVLNGVKKVLTTNGNGQATMAIANLAPKNYVATISYDGDATHIKSTATAKVTVKKANAKLTAKNKVYKVKARAKVYTVILKNNKGKALNKVKVTLKVKGKTFYAVVKNGKAIFKINNLNKKGRYPARVTFNGNNYYNKAIRNVIILAR